MIRQAANSHMGGNVVAFYFSQVVGLRAWEAVDNGGKSLCNTWSLSLITAENIFVSAERQISAKAARSGGTKWSQWLRLINASSRWRSAALVNSHQALEAYASLEIITDRYMVCNDESSIPCARNTLKACAQELMMRCVCSATDRLLVKVTPRILITVTRLIFGSGGGGCISSFLLRLLSTKTISAYLFRLALRLLVRAQSWTACLS